MPDFEIDNSDLSKLATDLGSVPAQSGKNLAQAFHVTSRNIRDAWREKATGLEHAPAFPWSITYDMGAEGRQTFAQAVSSVNAGGISDAMDTVLRSEIGPDKVRRQGALGNLIEYGSVNNPPMGFGHAALQENEDDFERGIDRAVDDALRKAGF